MAGIRLEKADFCEGCRGECVVDELNKGLQGLNLEDAFRFLQALMINGSNIVLPYEDEEMVRLGGAGLATCPKGGVGNGALKVTNY